MDNNTLAIVISILAVGVGVIIALITLIRQGGRHDADIANLRTSQETLRTDLLTEIRAQREEFREEMRALGGRIENAQAEWRAESRALGDRIENAQAEWRAESRALGDRIEGAQGETREEMRAQREEFREEMRALGDRIENRINLDERVRAVEQRAAANPEPPESEEAAAD